MLLRKLTLLGNDDVMEVLIPMLMVLWFELSLENTFKLRNGEEHVMDFVSRDETKLFSYLLNSFS